MANIQKVIDIAIGELGKQEIPKGSNWGTHVKKYLASVGLNFPASWCMAFVYWCFKEAGFTTAHKSGGVLNVWNSRPNNRVVTPKPGDVFIMDHGKGLGHTGIVVEVDGDKIHTIEGNTNDTGSREGIEVARKIRFIKSCKGFIRYTE